VSRARQGQPLDVYQVEVWYQPPDRGDDAPLRWRTYGRAGLTEAVESVDWEVRTVRAFEGTVERLPATVTDEPIEVYRRRSRFWVETDGRWRYVED
jgi:hypothetical protein